MPCLFALFAGIFPRVAVALVWLLVPGYLGRAIHPWWWALLGFIFMPLTTLAFAYGINSLDGRGHMPPLGWLLVAIAVVMDLGLMSSSRQAQKRRRYA